MKRFSYRLFVLMLLLMGRAHCEEPDDRWVASIKQLFGTWESVSTKELGETTKFRFTFDRDGTIKTKFTVGTFVQENMGVYTVGRNHIYFWAAGPPTGVEVKDPEAHSQAMLMSYKFEGDTLKVTILDGLDHAMLTLKKSTSEAITEKPTTHPESKSEGSNKPQPEAEGRSR